MITHDKAFQNKSEAKLTLPLRKNIINELLLGLLLRTTLVRGQKKLCVMRRTTAPRSRISTTYVALCPVRLAHKRTRPRKATSPYHGSLTSSMPCGAAAFSLLTTSGLLLAPVVRRPVRRTSLHRRRHILPVLLPMARWEILWRIAKCSYSGVTM